MATKQIKNDPVPALINKIPNWLRWILFLPMGYLLLAVVSNLLGIVLASAGLQNQLWTDALLKSVAVMTFVYTAAIIAPKHHKRVALVLGSLIAGGLVLVVMYVLFAGTPMLVNVTAAPFMTAALAALIPYLVLRRR